MRPAFLGGSRLSEQLELGLDFVDFSAVALDGFQGLFADGFCTLAREALHVLFGGSDALLQAGNLVAQDALLATEVTVVA